MSWFILFIYSFLLHFVSFVIIMLQWLLFSLNFLVIRMIISYIFQMIVLHVKLTDVWLEQYVLFTIQTWRVQKPHLLGR